jgi:DNA-binding response OmpR family regulator
MLSGPSVKMENRGAQSGWRRSGSVLAPPLGSEGKGCRDPSPKRMTRILVVEDQRSLLRSLIRGLEEEGYEVVPASSVGDAREALTQQPEVVVLDVMLPDGSGVDFLRQLRGEGFGQPILVLTARDSVDDRVKGLDAGADDYLVKPFSFNELLARLRALLRRGSLEQQAILRVEGLEVDRLNRVATRNGLALDLSNRQFELLSYLMLHAHTVVSREMIARDVWREATATWTNVIEVHIAQLRRKIERPDWPQLLHTVRGQGYLLGRTP